MKLFSGRVAVVTGGASGIGRALASAFIGEGMKVVLADVEEEALEATTVELSATGASVSAFQTDISDPVAVEALAEYTFDTYGACHLLCNNAGVGCPNAEPWETTPNDWGWLLSVNVAGVAHGIQSFVPRMLESKQEGHILNTSSGNGGISPLADASVYAASKAAVSTLTECLQSRLIAAGPQIRSSIFYPSGGLLKTGIWTTERNRPVRFAREKEAAGSGGDILETFLETMRKAGVELPVQDLDELAQFALEGVRRQDFVIMIGREQMEAQLIDRAKKLANGSCPID